MEAVSPIGKIFSTSRLSLCIHGVYELEQPIDVIEKKKDIKDILLPRNPRFCSIMVCSSCDHIGYFLFCGCQSFIL